MSVRTTSKESYYTLNDEGVLGKQALTIFNYCSYRKGVLSRREISVGTGISINAVTGRVNELIKEGYLREAHQSFDKVTNRLVWTVEVVK